MARRYDVVVWGSTGFTGRLTCEYLSKTYPDLKWAIAGRNPQVLEEIKKSLKLNNIDILVGNIDNQESLRAITSQTKVLLTTAGPYAKIGMPMVEACVEGGAHYCDLTGEAPFIRAAIDKFHDKAKEKNLKIVNCCGFDCIPCDLGTQMIAEEAESRGCTNGLQEIRFLADKMDGGASGGTLASAMHIFETLSFSQLLQLTNPFYLNPIDHKTKALSLPHNNKALYTQSCDNAVMGYDSITKRYTIPYMMQAIDLRLVNRSNALSNYRYGHNLVFTERMIVPNILIAVFGSIALTIAQMLLIFPISRYLIKPFLPKPGEGPSQRLLDHGFFTAKLWGKGLNASTGEEIIVQGSIQAYHGDPGYRQTAKMIAETAVCLAQDGEKLPQCYGIVTPSTALGPVLRRRLHARGIEFSIVV